jgi:tetratricopeptide (TPR) repeat protein
MEWEVRVNPWAGSFGYVRLGKYLSRRGWERDNPEIMASYQRAIEINPDSATLRRQVAELYRGLGQTEAARIEMAQSHFLMGRYYENKGSPAEAEKRYLEALSFQPDLRPALEGLIRLYQGPLADPRKAAVFRARLTAPEKAAPGP